MRNFLNKTLRVCGVAVLVVAGFAALPAYGQGRDFSDLTGASNIVTADDAKGTDWQARQAQIEAEARQALQSTNGRRAAVAPGQLSNGDKIRMNVYGEEELSGEFEVDNTGSLSLPLIGEMIARGKTPRELERAIAEVLERGYLKNPRVSVEVLNFRPFFILGEVNKPGSYPYSNEMSVINAVALGGGYTTRAKTGKVLVRRASNPEQEEWVSEDSLVYPGDVLRVDERFF